MADYELEVFVEQRKKILRAMRAIYPQGWTRREISRKLNMPINSVCGRVGELLDLKALQVRRKRLDEYTKKPNEELVYNGI